MTFPALPNFDFYRRLSRREQALVLLVSGTLFVLLNLLAIRTLANSFRELSVQRRAKTYDAETLRFYLKEKPQWEKRMRWLREKQPPLANRDVAGVKLQEQIKTLADQAKVILSVAEIVPVQLGAPASSDYQSVVFKFDAQGDWASTWKFLAGLQRPENFVAFESALLHTDPADSKVMKSSFRVAKWYAPTGKR